MDINKIESFIAAVESDTFFTPEGDPHRYETSASRDIIDLENEIGTPLFNREGMNMGKLTEAGKVFLQEAYPILHNYRTMMRHMAKYRTKNSGDMIIGTLPILKQYRLRSLFQRFVDDHPEFHLYMEEVDGKSLIEGLDEGYYDGIIVRENMILDRDYRQYKLASDELAAILPASHPLANEQDVTLRQLKNESFYLTNPYTPSFGICWQLLKKRHISTENVHTANVEDILPVIAQGHGVGLLPMSSLNVMKQKGVVAVTLQPRAIMEVVFAHRKDVALNEPMQALVDIIKQRAKRIPV